MPSLVVRSLCVGRGRGWEEHIYTGNARERERSSRWILKTLSVTFRSSGNLWRRSTYFLRLLEAGAISLRNTEVSVLRLAVTSLLQPV